LIRQLQPDVILSGMAHLNFLVLMLRPFLPRKSCILVRQNASIAPSLTLRELPVGTRILYRLFYPTANRVICQTPAMAAELSSQLGIREPLLAVLPNPVEVEMLRASRADTSTQWSGPGPHLVAVGRLSREKGFDLLLNALVAIRETLPSTDLVIAGTGPEEAALQAQCRQLGLSPSVRFVGYVNQPHKYFPGASAFVLSSRCEGLPNALLEAAAGGLPIVALPASAGLTDLLRGQPGVWLAPEVSIEALASSLLSALPALRPHQRFEHAFVDQFQMDRATHAYEELIESAQEARAR
jgi:glycosyltransferase involved in cell wall biosynthesis